MLEGLLFAIIAEQLSKKIAAPPNPLGKAKQLIFARNAVLIAVIPRITKELSPRDAIRGKVAMFVGKSGMRD